jgi:hypothetical protein
MDLIVMVTIILIHACLSNRTKQAGQTVKHAFPTGKQARQTVISITFDSCSSPFKSLISYNDCSLSPSKQATPTASHIQTDDCSSSPSTAGHIQTDDCSTSPSFIQTDDCSFRPSTNIQTDDCSTSPSFIDDCSFSPSIISKFQTEAFVDPPCLRSTATPEATAVAGPPQRPTATPATKALVDLPLHSDSTATEALVDLPLPLINKKPCSASQRLLQPVYIDLHLRSRTTATATSVDLHLRSTTTASVGLTQRRTTTASRRTNLVVAFLLPSIVAIPNAASLAGPPRQPTATVDIALVVSPPQFHTEASVDLPLHLTTTKAFVNLPLVRSGATTEATPLATCLVDLPLHSTTVVNLPLHLTTTAPYQPTKVIAAGLFVRLILLSSIIMSGLQTPRR